MPRVVVVSVASFTGSLAVMIVASLRTKGEPAVQQETVPSTSHSPRLELAGKGAFRCHDRLFGSSYYGYRVFMRADNICRSAHDCLTREFLAACPKNDL